MRLLGEAFDNDLAGSATVLAYTLHIFKVVDGRLRGIGCVKCGSRELGDLPYHVEVGVNGQASVVTFGTRPKAKNGDKLHLTLEDGRMLDCQLLDASPYCAVVGEGPYFDRRTAPRDLAR